MKSKIDKQLERNFEQIFVSWLDFLLIKLMIVGNEANVTNGIESDKMSFRKSVKDFVVLFLLDSYLMQRSFVLIRKQRPIEKCCIG